MSDERDSGGLIGTIISLLILAAIWPYLLALLGLYIAYVALITAFEWMAEHPMTVLCIVLGCVTLYCFIYYRLIPRVWSGLVRQIKNRRRPKVCRLPAQQDRHAPGLPDLTKRTFIPSTNLYCYWCTHKLGRQAAEHLGKYYCDDCFNKLSSIK